jgi:aldose 1-epimerase
MRVIRRGRGCATLAVEMQIRRSRRAPAEPVGEAAGSEGAALPERLREAKVTAPSGRQVELASGSQRAVVVQVGGGLRTYSVRGRDVVDGYGERSLCSSGRGQLLIPWPNRLQDGSYRFDGHEHQLPLDEPEPQNAIHGLVRWLTWDVVDCGDDSATLELLLHPRPGYPFTLLLRVNYALGGDGLTVRMDATNVGASACPYGAGAHPYLVAPSGRVDGESLHVPARTVLHSDDRGLPVEAAAVDGTELDFRSPRPVGAVEIDHCYTDLDRDADGRVRVPFGDAMLWADGSFPYVMVFTGDGLPDVDRRALAVEPMTCPPNAFRSGVALIRLEPGESHSGSWGITP